MYANSHGARYKHEHKAYQDTLWEFPFASMMVQAAPHHMYICFPLGALISAWSPCWVLTVALRSSL